MRRFLCLALMLLAACDGSSVRDTIGLSRKAPDEFRVVSRPPLSVPPEFNLRPPAGPGETDGDGRAVTARSEAQGLVLGGASTAVQPVTGQSVAAGADAQFLSRAGADMADPSIRRTLEQETSDLTPEGEEKGVIDQLRETGNNQPVVQAEKEAERLKANRAENKPVTEGETPMKKPRDTGPLGKILGY